jgi:hypothetical protein
LGYRRGTDSAREAAGANHLDVQSSICWRPPTCSHPWNHSIRNCHTKHLGSENSNDRFGSRSE